MQHIVKRRGHLEEFDPKKIYGSSYFACRNAHLSEIQSEKIAESVSMAVEKWIGNKKSVSSNQIFEKVTNILEQLEPDAAFLYKTHRDLS